MGKFTVIPQDTFAGLQLDAGVLLKKFTPATPAAPADEDIICATTGGINATCVPTYSDLGEDVDNCPVNMKELKHLDSWECKLSFTSLGLSANAIKLALGAADISATATITPAAVENFFNIFVAAFIEVPRGCCVTVAAENTSTQAILFDNSNFIAERVS